MNEQLRSFLNKKFTKDTFWLIFAQLVLTTSGLFINLIISANTDKAFLGIFNQVLGIYMILTVLFSLGINASIVQKTASNKKEDLKFIFSSGLLITIISSILLSIIALLVVKSFPQILSSPEVVDGFFCVVIGIPFFNINKNFLSLYTGRKEQRLFSIIRALRWFFIITIIGLNGLIFQNLELNFLSIPVTEITLSIILIIDNRKYLTINIKKQNVLENFVFGIKSFFAEVFAILKKRLDIVVLGYFLTQSETGIYSFYIFFVRALYIFPGILNQNFKPIFAKHWKDNSIEKLQVTMKQIRKVNVIITAISALGLIAGYFVLVSFFYTSYENSFYYLLVNILCAIPGALIGWGGGLLLMAGKLNENIARTLIILVFSTLLLIFSTHYFGLIGAVTATSISYIFTFGLLYKFVQRTLNIKLI